MVDISRQERLMYLGLITQLAVYENKKVKIYVGDSREVAEATSTDYLHQESEKARMLTGRNPTIFRKSGWDWYDPITYIALSTERANRLDASVLEILSDGVLLTLKEIRRGIFLRERARKLQESRTKNKYKQE